MCARGLQLKKISEFSAGSPFRKDFLCRSENTKLSYQNHSIPYWIVAQPGWIALPLGMHTSCCFFSFKNFGIWRRRKKKQRVFLGQESSVPWKFRAPVSEGLAEVTDSAAAEPGRLGLIATNLSVRLDLQASAWSSAWWWLKVRVTSLLTNPWRLRK